MSNIREIENKSIFIVREAYNKFNNPALLWSMGKDSTVLLWLCRKAFFGKVPMKVIHIDTGYKFKEIYDFRDRYAKEWNIDLSIVKNNDADRLGIVPEKGRFECCNFRKTQALKSAVIDMNLDALIVGIRRDEHGIRGKERYFSPRDSSFGWNIFKQKDEKRVGDSPFIPLQDAELSGWNIFATDFGVGTDHVRIHPLLHWTEEDIWEYIKKENIPIVSLYLSKDNKRYRSIGCECCCNAVKSNAGKVDMIIEELKTTKVKERDGRDQDKEDEYNMQKLRSLGYM
ncbi:MAG: sulfate adenylyltransferase subunit CysD [archaeon]